MASVELIYDVKTPAYLTANPTKVLASDEPIYVVDGDVAMLAFGDGSTQLADLTFYRMVVQPSELISGGAITVGSYGGSGSDNDIRVAAATWYVSGSGTFSTSANTDFNDISLSSSGTQRYVLLYGKNDGTIAKLEGSEAAIAALPSTPADSAVIGYVLVTDAALGSSVDLSGYLLRADKATSAEIRTGTNDDKYITPLGIKTSGIQPRSTSVASSATPSINTDLYDCFSITALAAAITSFTTNLTGTPVNFQPLIIRIKDNGVARAITWGASFTAMGESLPTTTTINKILTVAFLYDSVLAKWGCVGVKTEV